MIKLKKKFPSAFFTIDEKQSIHLIKRDFVRNKMISYVVWRETALRSLRRRNHDPEVRPARRGLFLLHAFVGNAGAGSWRRRSEWGGRRWISVAHVQHGLGRVDSVRLWGRRPRTDAGVGHLRTRLHETCWTVAVARVDWHRDGKSVATLTHWNLQNKRKNLWWDNALRELLKR